MRLEDGLKHQDPKMRKAHEIMLKAYEEGRCKEKPMFDSVRHPRKNSRPFRIYWSVKEEIKMRCRVLWRKVFPYKVNLK